MRSKIRANLSCYSVKSVNTRLFMVCLQSCKIYVVGVVVRNGGGGSGGSGGGGGGSGGYND